MKAVAVAEEVVDVDDEQSGLDVSSLRYVATLLYVSAPVQLCQRLRGGSELCAVAAAARRTVSRASRVPWPARCYQGSRRSAVTRPPPSPL
eukprot:COSAG05_NODE_917_length_6593_cov_8.024484_6_plen_91_part_00